MGPVSEEEFQRVASGLRWSPKNLEATKALLVQGQSHREVAATHSMTPQTARTLQVRFMAKLRALRAMKISPEEYLSRVPALELFKPALLQLRRSGLTDEQLLDYLKQNDVQTTLEQVQVLVADERPTSTRTRAKRNENAHAGKSKGRRR